MVAFLAAVAIVVGAAYFTMANTHGDPDNIVSRSKFLDQEITD